MTPEQLERAREHGRQAKIRLQELKRELEALEYVPAPDGASDAYAGMWHVAKNAKKWDKTHEHVRLREFLAAKPDQFQAQFTALQRDHRPTQGGGKVEKDDDLEGCVQLIDQLLEEKI